MRGRPSTKTPEVIEEICTHIAHGGSLAEWCENEGRPGYRTIMTWLTEDPKFQQQYARAREDQGDFYAEKVVSTAENCSADFFEIQKARLQMDAYKWAAAKRKPKVYGDKLNVESQGAIEVRVSYADASRPSDALPHGDAIDAEVISETSQNVQGDE